MKELFIYKKHMLGLLTAIKKPAVIVPALGLVSLTDCQLAFFLLLIFLAADFLTGVIASWSIWKASKIDSSFWKTEFSSYKIRMSIIKTVTYFLLILLTYGIEVIFRIKTFENTLTEHEITLTLVSIAIACAVEFYSIFFENLPKAGFDIEKKVKAIFVKVKKAVISMKSLKNDDNSIT